jgi:hypothetical protein
MSTEKYYGSCCKSLKEFNENFPQIKKYTWTGIDNDFVDLTGRRSDQVLINYRLQQEWRKYPAWNIERI